MIILGLQFGHDGAACVIKDGKILSCISREREARIKHVVGVTTHEVDKSLKEAAVSIDDITHVAISSTQGFEVYYGLIEDFKVKFEKHKDDSAPSSLYEAFKRDGISVSEQVAFKIKTKLKTFEREYLQELFAPEEVEKYINEEVQHIGCLNNYIADSRWYKKTPLESIKDAPASDFINNEMIQNGYHHPLTVEFRGRSIPGYFVEHHASHAASAYYQSSYDESAILTHDGDAQYSGMIYYARNNKIFPVWPHFLNVGMLYEDTARRIGLGHLGGPGKLMGLAPYGEPEFFDEAFVENRWGMKDNILGFWNKHFQHVSNVKGYDMSAFGDSSRVLEPVNANMAASTQKLMEETLLKTTSLMDEMFKNNGMDVKNLCVAGGVFLNCPANSRILNEGAYDNLYIPPYCADDGLAVGAAQYVYYHLYDNEFVPLKEEEGYPTPYLGPEITKDSVESALKAEEKVTYNYLGDEIGKHAAVDVHENKVIAWFEGGSESGPRALGHRSLVSNATFKDNWERVNNIKHRELWRPFAPAVLREESENWFEGAPKNSPYMLFTAQVKTDKLPAITHVDGSSRIQTVDESCGDYYKLIKEYSVLSGVPVVMNTSLNDRGEPIVEEPEQAIKLFLKSDIDVLYMSGYKVEKTV